MADIFISYARDDFSWVGTLAESLGKAGYSIWWDRDLSGGSRYQREIESELRSAKAVIVAWTRASVNSHWVMDEAEVARGLGTLVPVTPDGTLPPLGFRQYQVVDLSGWRQDGDPPFRKLLDTLDTLAGAPHRSAADIVLSRPALAVLPFVNMSGDPAQEYFVDGITEDLITALAAWRWFPVIARNSTFVYRGRAVDVTQVGKELGARYVLEGSVRRAGERVRVTAQLIEASTAHHLWAQTYDREIDDVFALQDELTRALIGAIEPRLSQAEQQRALRKTPDNLDAWDLSLRAMADIRRGTVQSLARAETLLIQAVEKDCNSSYAQSLLALTRFQGALFGWLNDPTGSLLSTYEAALRAVELDDGDWLAHALLGIATLWCHRAYDRATAEVETAISLNPSAAMAYHFSGCVLTFNDQPRAALPKLQAVLQLDPRFQLLPTTLADIALAHFLLGDGETAVAFCDRALGEQPEHLRAWHRKAAALGTLGHIEEAREALSQVLKLHPQFGKAYLDATYPFRDPTYRRMLENGLEKAGWVA